MDHDLYGAQRKVWKMLKNMKKPVNEYVHVTGVTTEVSEEYFKKLYDVKDTQVAEGYQTASSVTVTEMEIRTRLKTLQDRKAPGTDDIILIKLLKYGDSGLAATLFQSLEH